jgi:hypothetical protein
MISADHHASRSRSGWASAEASPLELVFDILRRAPPVVWPDPARRRIWAEYLGGQIGVGLSPIWGADRHGARAVEEVVAAMLFLGPPPQVEALAHGQWAHERAGDALWALLPLVESRRTALMRDGAAQPQLRGTQKSSRAGALSERRGSRQGRSLLFGLLTNK